MKDDFNIEEVFKQKLKHLEKDVNPELWSKISQGLGATSTGAAAGMSALVKTILISGGIVAAGITAIYVGVDNDIIDPNKEVVVEEIIRTPEEVAVIVQDSVINVEDINDPIIIKNREEIERGLENIVYEEEIDQSFIDQHIIPIEVDIETLVENDGKEEDEAENNNLEENIEEITEAVVPSGRMVYSPVNGSAPVLINFESNAKNFTSVKWDFGDGTTGKGINVKHKYSRPGNYNVKMTVFGEGTVYEESKVVEIKTQSSIDNIPNVITPDGDRINDLFFVKTTEIKTFFISIRDTKGNVVFESNDKSFEWDGIDLFNNKVESGTYIFTIIAEGEDGSVFKIPGQLYVRY